MSFLKNLRSSVTRKQNSVNKTSLARSGGLSDNTRRSVRSVLSSRKEEEQQSDGLVRSETFTVDNHESIFVRNQESTRASMFGRFSTFTKKKKSSKRKDEELKTKDENISNSYKRYPTPSDIVSGGNDPFHYLYEKGNPNSQPKEEYQAKAEKTAADYGTYRKNKLPLYVKEQLEENPETFEPPRSKHDDKRSKEKPEEEDKYKTVTINSFRKSFRERFLNQQRDVPYNPAWFVEVEVPKQSEKEKEEEKRRRQDLFVYENEQYRPAARSPIRHMNKSPTRSPTRQLARSPTREHTRSPTRRSRSPGRSSNRSPNRQTCRSPDRPSRLSPIRSPNRSPIPNLGRSESPVKPQSRPAVSIKRNETFKIERENNEPSIRIEIKNSITPNEPGRIVPVGVAKPIQSPIQNGGSKIIQRSWTEQGRDPSSQHHMYQTCIQITNSKDVPSRSLRDRNSNHNPQSYRSRKVNSSGPIISNYSPLKSYEILSNIRRRNEIIPTGVYKEKPRDPQQTKAPVMSQTYETKKWNAAPTFSSQQKVSTHAADKLVRREATNNRNPAANPRRFPTKSPWR